MDWLLYTISVITDVTLGTSSIDVAIFIAFSIIVIIVALITFLGVRSSKNSRSSIFMVVLFLLSMPIIFGCLNAFAGRPLAVSLYWWKNEAEVITVLAASIHENKSIFLWVQDPWHTEPRALQLPWNREVAEQLQSAQQLAEDQKTEVQMRIPFEASLDDDEPMFYAIPQPAPLPKDVPNQALEFRP